MAKTSEFSIVDIFSYDNLIHAFAGATGSVVAMTTFFPLDTVRTRLQGNVYLWYVWTCCRSKADTHFRLIVFINGEIQWSQINLGFIIQFLKESVTSFTNIARG